MSDDWHKNVFWGMHFDLHAHKDDKHVGAGLTVEGLVRELSKVDIDWVQCDCMGAYGLACYPSEFAYVAPGLEKDSIAVWREATRQLGIPLALHFGAIANEAAIEAHPEWARVNGPFKKRHSQEIVPETPDKTCVCLNSPYTDELLVPVMQELVKKYGVDGFWMDGTAASHAPCFCEKCKTLFRAATGIETVPLFPGDDNWDAWAAFHRDSFRKHIDKYIEAVKSIDPKVTVTGNFVFSARDPAKITNALDYLTTDCMASSLTLTHGLRESRQADSRGVDWDLMDWTFTNSGIAAHWEYKTAEAMCREAAIPLSCGGKFQMYDTPNRDGEIMSWHLDIVSELARFVRARQPYCEGTASFPQAAVISVKEHLYSRMAGTFGLEGIRPVDGAMYALLDSGYHADIVLNDDIMPVIDKYPLVILPEQDALPPEHAKRLLEYVRSGGNLIVSGADNTKYFDGVLGVTDTGEKAPDLYVPYGRRSEVLNGEWRKVVNDSAYEVKPLLKSRDRGEFELNVGSPAATVKSYGKGRIAGIYGPVFDGYLFTGYTGIRNIAEETIEAMAPAGLIRAALPAGVHMTMRTKGSKLLVNLVNLRTDKPMSPKSAMVDSVPDCGPVSVTIGMENSPSAVYLAPGGKCVDWSYDGGKLSVTIKSIGIYDILVIEK